MNNISKFILLIFTVAIYSSTFSQEIKFQKIKGNNYKFTKGEKKLLNFKEVINSMQDNSEAYNFAKKSKTTRTIGTITSLTGSGFIGFFLGGVLARETNWAIGGIGLGLFALEFPLASIAKKRIFKAVDIYNSSLKTAASYNHIINTKLVLNHDGFGMKLNF